MPDGDTWGWMSDINDDGRYEPVLMSNFGLAPTLSIFFDTKEQCDAFIDGACVGTGRHPDA